LPPPRRLFGNEFTSAACVSAIAGWPRIQAALHIVEVAPLNGVQKKYNMQHQHAMD
jgi:hypothetical protein